MKMMIYRAKAVLHQTTLGILKLTVLYGRRNVNTAKKQCANYSTRHATSSVISAVRHLASYASRNIERNGFKVKVVSMFIAVTRMHSLEGTLCSTVQIVSTKVQGVEILTARASLSITNKTKKQMGGDFYHQDSCSCVLYHTSSYLYFMC